MSLTRVHIATSLILAAVLVTAPAGAQRFPEPGVLSGTGLTILPGPGVAPAAHWRVSYDRVDYLRGGLRGMNVFGLGYGLSSHIEGYARLTSEQVGTISSATSQGFGVKGAIPVDLPVIEASGIWFETTVSEQERPNPFFPVDATRGALTLSLGSPVLRAVVVGGVSSVGSDAAILSGGGVMWAPTGGIMAGAEVVRGYAGGNSVHAMMDILVRVIPHVLLMGSPGYISTATADTWTMSLGLCLTTADFDFRPAAAETRKEEYRLPSLEDIMKDSSEEKKQ